MINRKENESRGSRARCPYSARQVACHPRSVAIRENGRNCGFPSSLRRCVRYPSSRDWVDWVSPEAHLAQTISCSRATMRQSTQLPKRMRHFSTTRDDLLSRCHSLSAVEKVELSGVGRGLETVPRAWNCHEQVIPDWAEATTMSMLGPLTCSALTVIDPAFPPDEVVCSLTTRLMPPGNEIARFGLDTAMVWPAATKPTTSAFPLTEA